MGGVTLATVKLNNQLMQKETDIPLPRMSRGKTSEATINGRGPHVMANEMMYQKTMNQFEGGRILETY